MDLTAKRLLVVGLGVSGAAVARFARGRGALVTATDMAPADRLGAVVPEMEQLGVHLELGRHETGTFQQADLVVVSPGVPGDLKPLRAAAERGVPCIGEIELAVRFLTAPILAVTGTNGKTTVTTLLGQMLERSDRTVFVGGNIGRPLIEAVGLPHLDAVVVEVSSFQLDTIDTFHPAVAVLLNIGEDHLDRYDGPAAYGASKGRIFINQTPADTAVVNGNDPLTVEAAAAARGRVLNFYGRRPNGRRTEPGAWFDGRKVRISLAAGSGDWDLDPAAWHLRGRHHLENVMAAALAAGCAGASAEGVAAAACDFRGLPHRLEFVARIDGVDYVNDSKATNVHAVQGALEAFDRPIIWIAGGRDKGSDFGRLIPAVRRRVRELIVVGEAAGAIGTALAGTVPIRPAADLNSAVTRAAETARAGDVVLLSPACASFDMFDSYAHRGDAFRQAVEKRRSASSQSQSNGSPANER